MTPWSLQSLWSQPQAPAGRCLERIRARLLEKINIDLREPVPEATDLREPYHPATKATEATKGGAVGAGRVVAVSTVRPDGWALEIREARPGEGIAAAPGLWVQLHGVLQAAGPVAFRISAVAPPLYLVADEPQAAELRRGRGVTRGQAWTVAEIQRLAGLVGLTVEGAQRLAAAKVLFDATVEQVIDAA